MEINQSQGKWSESLIEELNVATRLYLFDWELIATHLQQFVVANQLSVEISPDTCRENFAVNNLLEPQNRISNDSIGNENFSFVQDRKINSLPDYEGMSLEDLIETVNRNEREIKRKKEDIFQRVLNSLGEFEPIASLVMLEDPAISAYQTAITKRIERERIQILKREESLEREKLEQERERLRRRFDPDSEDSLGENPQIMEKNKDICEVEETPIQISESFSLQSFIDGEEFERVLTELEKELDAQAMEKSGSLSELGEVIQFLETKGDTLKKEADLAATILAESKMLAQMYAKTIDEDQKIELKQSETKETHLASDYSFASSTLNCNRNRKYSENEGEIGVDNNDDEGDSESDNDSDWRRSRAQMKSNSKSSQQRFIDQSSTDTKTVVCSPSISSKEDQIMEQQNHNQANESHFGKESELLLPESTTPTAAAVEGLQKAITFLEQVIPVISADSVPIKSGSLLSGSIARREKRKKKP